MRASKLVLSVVMPGCSLWFRVFLMICCQVFMSVRTSWSVSPLIWMWTGGLGGPFRLAWKVTSLRNPWDKKRLATMHSWTMSSLPASCRVVKFGSVFPWREKRTNSRGKGLTCLLVWCVWFNVLFGWLVFLLRTLA